MKLVGLLAITTTVVSAWAQASITYDSSGFPNCMSTQSGLVFFTWDRYTAAESKQLFYVHENELKKLNYNFPKQCPQGDDLNDLPMESLRPVENTMFPSIVQESAAQLKSGGRIYRSEKTAQEFYELHKSQFSADQSEVLSNLKSKYGSDFANQVIQIWAKDLIQDYNQDKSCQSWVGSCDFYICQDQKNPCGASGYNLGFGYKYCSDSKFKLYNRMKTEKGRKWVKDVFTCLQNQNLVFADSLTSSSSARCEQIQKSSIQSHAGCYADAGFCDLELSEKVNIFRIIKKEILSLSTVTQGLEILKRCGSENIEALATEPKE